MSHNNTNQYNIVGPAVISFSGGRTSGFMLNQIIEEMYTKPHDVWVIFANTGKERPETLEFIHKCESWGWPITWLEWTREKPKFKVVSYETASRNGEPFEALINQKQSPPSPFRRSCTESLKVHTIERFMRSKGHKEWTNVIGLRHDEGYRLLKMYARNDKPKQKWKSYAPLAKDRIVKDDVMDFWKNNDFDLGLEPWESNCDLCFLKNKGLRRELIRRQPHLADWWIAQEEKWNRHMADDHYVSDLLKNIDEQPLLPLEDEHDVECGLLCGGEDE